MFFWRPPWVLPLRGPGPVRGCSLHPAPVDPAGLPSAHAPSLSKNSTSTRGPLRSTSDPVGIPSHKEHQTQASSIMHHIMSPRTPSDPISKRHHTQAGNTVPRNAQCGSHRILTGSRRRNSPNPSERHNNALHRATADPVGPRQYHAPNPSEEHSSAQGSVRIPSDPVRIPTHSMHQTQAISITHDIASPRLPSDPASK